MHSKPNEQLELKDGLVTIPANDFLNRLAELVNWQPLERALPSDVSGDGGPPGRTRRWRFLR